MPGLFHAVRELPQLCQGSPASLRGWLEKPTGARLLACILAITAGCGCYGFTLGLWRAPLMGNYVSVKLPLLVMATLLTNGLLNGMLAQVLGSGLTFRQTMLALLMSFASFSLITGALSPVALFAVLDAPAPGEPGASRAHQVFLVMHTLIIAFAGIVAHRRFFPVLAAASGHRGVALRVFLAWLAGNLLVGAQLSWNLRPFFGQPGRPLEFVRPDWNQQSFYENFAAHLLSLAGSVSLPLPAIVAGLGLMVPVAAAVVVLSRQRRAGLLPTSTYEH